MYEPLLHGQRDAGRRLLSITLLLVAGYVVINMVIGFKNFLNAYDIIVGPATAAPATTGVSP